MLPALVRETARRFGSRAAVVGPDGLTLTYADLERLSSEVANGLRRRGIGEGDVVGLALPSGPDYAVAYLGIAAAGAVTAGVNPRLAPPERRRLIEQVGAGLVIGTPDLLDGLDGFDGEVVAAESATASDAVLDGVRDGSDRPALEPRRDRPVVIVFTSGTTGQPRGALFTNRQLAGITRIDTGGRWGGGGPMLVTTELVHIGFMTKFAWYLRLGTRIHLLRRWRAEDVLRTVSEERMPTIGGVSAHVRLLLRAPDFDSYDLDCVETVVMGGGPSPPDLVHEARRRFGAAYSIRYSSTESGGVGTSADIDRDDDPAVRTVGTPRPGVEVEIRGDDRAPVDDGEPGEVWLRSPAVMDRYWGEPAVTAETIVGGWLRTGDIGVIEDGRLRLVGRSSEMFIRGGYNVHPQEVEAILRDHDGVADVAVVARPDPVMGEIGVAVIVPRSRDAPPTLEDVRRFGERRLARHKLPEDLLVVEGLPVTSMGKIDRAALADRVGGRV